MAYLVSRRRTKAHLLSIMLEGVAEGMIATDLKGRVYFINPAAEEITGWTRSAALGISASDVLRLSDEKTKEPLEDPLAKSLREGKVLALGSHVMLTTREGAETPIEASASPIRDADGKLRGAVMLFRDISRTRQMTDLASHSQKMEAVGRLASGVAGDFNNLLTVMTGYSELMRAELAPGNPLRRFADEIQLASERAEAIVTDLEAPLLTFQTYFLMGDLRLEAGDRKAAYDSFQRARKGLETLRSSLRGQELKISFVKDRLEVYERLVDLCLSGHAGPDPLHEAFEFMEQAKSRSLVDLMFQAATAQAPAPGQSALVRNIRNLREELNWYYHRIEQEQLQTEERSPERIERLREEAKERESRFVRTLREMPSDELASTALVPPGTMTVEEVRAALAPIPQYWSTSSPATKSSPQSSPKRLCSRCR